ncbi:MAG TPA: SDR family oxidoreductase [Sulfurovum sp.]|jgi:UDP-N-acetylglucosamine 4-epimerase|nr:MAG: LPS biosynthesis protein WbpP [Sulfurovum sp. 35-42-20]OYZ24585.1 MAG: LPS biosynthesis protein WbpP [Sulfurovum sp. 16-42-52]OYZ47620.1 MAG: LPS biosynthesis protein WbpP [Sulfurovum sp. 24-42-9]OZA61292.1 MAG: LPS biosynthesis protein WbpP [Sulfurovum sp. 39-42-12]HQR74735.1 SDR family oxidoreductase [Sulfurovum sp.]
MTAFEKLLEYLKTEQKTWLVTGNAGFIGSNLTEFLLKHNQKVVGLDNFSTGYRHNIEDVLAQVGKEAAKNFRFIEGDIADFEVCMRACEGVDIVLHQAALGSVPRSIEDPVTSNRSNVTGFLNMLTAAKEAGIKRFVYASSSSVYGDSEELPKVEERTGKLLSPYAAMKMTNELYAGVFQKCYGMETLGLRYFNVFGRRQDPNGAYAAVIPKWVGSLLEGEDVYINGDGETSRDFTYIDNVIQMNLLAGTTQNVKAFGEAFNVAVGGRNTLNELYALIKNELNNSLITSHQSPITKEPIYRDFRAGDIRHSNADITKAQNFVGYVPTHDIYQGMQEALGWYMGQYNAR